MGDELMKRETEDMEKLKAYLANSSTSFKATLLANINLVGTNKDLEEKLERANTEVTCSARGARSPSEKKRMRIEGPVTSTRKWPGWRRRWQHSRSPEKKIVARKLN